ncbi:MAG TPA: hypothetical protein VID77_08970 [Stellaceae bacterium]|jgi:hypothetical protein
MKKVIYRDRVREQEVGDANTWAQASAVCREKGLRVDDLFPGAEGPDAFYISAPAANDFLSRRSAE